MPAGLLSLCFCYQAGLTPEGATPAAPRKATPGQLQFGKAERPGRRQGSQGTGVASKGLVAAQSTEPVPMYKTAWENR